MIGFVFTGKIKTIEIKQQQKVPNIKGEMYGNN